MTDASHIPAGAPLERIQCQWCQSMNEKTALACRACGAPLDIRNLVSESGWREAPRIRDMTEIHFSSSTCQVEGEIVPVAEINLGAGDSIFFEHHVMLWKDDHVPLSVMQLSGGMKRAFAGMPFIISVATGPGRIAFSRDATGELVVLPLHPGMELDVREHAFLLCSHQIGYSFMRVKGLDQHSVRRPGHVHGPLRHHRHAGPADPARLRQRLRAEAGAGESIMVEPGAFLYKDSSVTMDVEFQKLGTGFFGGTNMSLARMTGPGRVGIQSMYVHHHTE